MYERVLKYFIKISSVHYVSYMYFKSCMKQLKIMALVY